ncbi:vWA domain-containing protein [Meiothermus granaticius]|uniref:vWA domain-containing protein n=2 Tax=Meiothermus granaticius TaxID=863370 RepID=UPI001196A71D|nr:VWA domain-containing protein [Meiothermus granaticius]GEM86584.1 hypothetical protein MGR01S_12090 [Meiothermus granaticius NBRC 107808]
MYLTFGLPWLLALLPPTLGLVWWWYRRKRPPERRVAGLWLWQKAQRQGRSRRRLDLRLLLLLLAAALMVLALAAPRLALERPGEVIVVISAAASMGATDLPPSRLERAKAEARKQLSRAPRAVLVVAAEQPQSFGPALGRTLLEPLATLRATARSADLAAAIARGKGQLPGARTLVIADAPAPLGADGYINVAGNGPNVGITAVGPGFMALANAGPGPWRGTVSVNGKSYPVQVPAGGYSSLEVPAQTFQARIEVNDALALDNTARFDLRRVRVAVSGDSPALERLLGLLGTSRARPAELAFGIGTPPAVPAEFTVYFAPTSSGQAQVFDVERTLPYLRGAELVGYTLDIPPKPEGSGWQPLAVSEDGQALAWYRPNGLYLPPIESLQNLPAFPVLLYNLIAPRAAVREGLLSSQQTLLPRPSPNQPLPPSFQLSLAPWLALLAALLLAAEFYRFQARPPKPPEEAQPLTPASPVV